MLIYELKKAARLASGKYRIEIGYAPLASMPRTENQWTLEVDAKDLLSYSRLKIRALESLGIVLAIFPPFISGTNSPLRRKITAHQWDAIIQKALANSQTTAA